MPGNKLATRYQVDDFTVVNKEGPKATVVNNKTQRTYIRNVAHLKKIPSKMQQDFEEESNQMSTTSEPEPRRTLRQRKLTDRYGSTL